MKNNFGWAIAIVLAIICLILYFGKRDCPEIRTGVTIQVDTVFIHDTTTVTKTVRDVVVRYAEPPQIVENEFNVDSLVLPARVIFKSDTPVCYSFAQEYKDNSYIQAEMCSRFFDPAPPPDFFGNIIYKPGNDTMNLYRRVDTVPVFVYKKPIIPTWQAVTLGLCGGVLAGWLMLK